LSCRKCFFFLKKIFKLNKFKNIKKIFYKEFPEYNGQINLHSHHLCHAANVFFSSPFEKATILSVDGVGEWETTWLGTGSKNEIKKIDSNYWPNSLGEFYASATEFLGYKFNCDEYKVMGMAPLGKPIFYEDICKLVSIVDTSIKVNESFFQFHLGRTPLYELNKFTSLFGKPSVYSKIPSERDKNLASSFQKLLSEIFCKLVANSIEKTKNKNLCLTGGVSMNCSAVGDLIRKNITENVFLNFASADDGCAIGAAYLECKKNSDKFRRISIKNAFLGDEWGENIIEDHIKEYKLSYSRMDESIFNETAKLLYKDKIIGWFQDGTEFGQRALGARSILASPLNKDMKNLINQKIKNRENYRPFAPSVTLDEANNYFHMYDQSSPFMTHTFKVRDEYVKKIPAVVHVDGTSRVQTVEENNTKFFKLLNEFKKLSNIPILLNTSFNVNGEPIVNTPREAIKCLLNTKIDFLAIGPFLVSQK